MKTETKGIIAGFSFLIIVAILAFTIPNYLVWKNALRGKAALREAEWNRKIKIEEAEAHKQSARLLAEAEVERAKGVAEANQIIGESLQNNEAYLRYLWVQGLNDGRSEVIYVATEANLPILEASRLSK